MRFVSCKTVAAIGLGVLLAASGATRAETDSSYGLERDDDVTSRQLEGTWVLTVTPPFGAPSFLAIASYARGGVLVTSPDRLPPNLGATLNDALGSWRATGHRTFVSTHVEFRYGPMGTPIGTMKLRASGQITRQDVFEGLGQLQLCDAILENCEAPSPVPATVVGRRLRAEAPIRP